MFRSLMTIIRELYLYLTKVIFMSKRSVKLRRFIYILGDVAACRRAEQHTTHMPLYDILPHHLIYTGCPRRNVPDFGRVFLMLKYTDITQNTYIQS